MPFKIGNVASLNKEATVYRWKPDVFGYEPYKDVVLAAAQAAIRDKLPEITDDKVRILMQQLIQENGALSFDRKADEGGGNCAYGIPQRFISGCRLQTFLKQNPDFATAEGQIQWWVDRVATNYRNPKINGDIQRTVVAHQNPNAVLNEGKRDTCRYVGDRFSCYYSDEVSSRSEYLTP